MGYGDILMIMGEAKLSFEKNALRCVMSRFREAEGSELYKNLPYIINENQIESGEKVVSLKKYNYMPYIDWTQMTTDKIVYKKYTPKPAELLINNSYLDLADRFHSEVGDFIFIEPHVKDTFTSNNRDWGWENYVDLVNNCNYTFVQPDYGLRILPGVVRVKTPNFLSACAILSRAKTAVFSEGGFMHAAAALGIRSVVIYGGVISPEITGYKIHYNFYSGGEPCGSRNPCKHCKKAMKKIPPRKVIKKLKTFFDT